MADKFTTCKLCWEFWCDRPERGCRWPPGNSSGHRYLGWRGAGLMVAELCCQWSWLYSHNPLRVRPDTALQTRERRHLEQDREDEATSPFIQRRSLFPLMSILTHRQVRDCPQWMEWLLFLWVHFLLHLTVEGKKIRKKNPPSLV